LSANEAEADDKKPYPSPAARPTQNGPLGLTFDFNLGARVMLPEGASSLRVRLWDRDTGNILFESSAGAAFVNSSKRYFIRFGIEVFDGDERVFAHDYDCAERAVLVQFPIGTLGDIMGWFPYAVKFQERHGCRLTCAMSGLLIPLFRDAYPDITFVTHEEVRPELFYASYCIGLFFDDDERLWQPCDFRLVGLHRTAGYILGVDPREMPPLLGVPDTGPPLDGPYVCIAVQSTTQAKYWNNPLGWRTVVQLLKDRGFRVVCIDQKPAHGGGIVWNHLPHGVEDMTGDVPLAERVNWLRHAAAFIGLSSGLSWLAWAAGAPVVMISGFTHPTNEFHTPYRVINYHACNSCWNDVRHRFDHKDFLYCPRQAGTSRQFECTRLITAEQVIATLKTLPAFAFAMAPPARVETARLEA
jgi:autotransporter strand-loop-strand O-heptosyltransferase